MLRKVLAGAALLVSAAAVAACSAAGSSQSSLGPFTITTPCHLVWEDGTWDGVIYPSRAAAAAHQGSDTATQGAEFTITLTATADLSGGMTVAYYDAAGTEIATGTATLDSNGPSELTAGQRATFLDSSQEAPVTGAASCQVIGGDGNE